MLGHILPADREMAVWRATSGVYSRSAGGLNDAQCGAMASVQAYPSPAPAPHCAKSFGNPAIF
jgi:hypothetical protein